MDFPERKRLYEKGLNDREIAEEVGVSPSTIRDWRNCRELPPNGPSHPSHPWTSEEIKILKNEYPKRGSSIPQLLDHRTRKQIRTKANREGIHCSAFMMNGKLVQKHEKPERGVLKTFYLEEDESFKKIAERFGCSATTVGNWLKSYGLVEEKKEKKGGPPSPENLRKLYLEERLPVEEIAKRLNLSVSGIYYWINKLEISRDSVKFEVNKKDLERMYRQEKMSPKEIAEKLGKSQRTVYRRIKEWGIPTRSMSEAVRVARERDKSDLKQKSSDAQRELGAEELLNIVGLKDQGYGYKEIIKKLDLTVNVSTVGKYYQYYKQGKYAIEDGKIVLKY